MNKISLLFILLVIWILGGSWWWACKVKGYCDDGKPYVENSAVENENPAIKGLNITDGSFATSSKDNLIFDTSKSGAIIKTRVQNSLNELSDYLKSNPSKKVYLTGLYKTAEQNVPGFRDLGLARAADIKKNLSNLGVNANQLVTGSKIDNGLYEANDLVYGAVDFAFSRPNGFSEGGGQAATATGALVQTPTTNIQDGSLNVNINDAILFDRNSDNPKISTEVSSGLTKVADYLKASRNRILQVTGLYDRSEKNSTLQPNLGLARAEAVKSELVKKGASPDQISTTYSLEKIPFRTGFVEYSFKTKQEIASYEQEMLAKVQSNLEKIGSMNVYFQTGSDDIDLSNELASFIDDVKYYLAKKPSQKVKLIGHTDNVGNAQSNTTLGLGRANTIKEYFVRGGVKASQIATSSEGPNKPIASNDTDDGRSKNRRVEISIK